MDNLLYIGQCWYKRIFKFGAGVSLERNRMVSKCSSPRGTVRAAGFADISQWEDFAEGYSAGFKYTTGGWINKKSTPERVLFYLFNIDYGILIVIPVDGVVANVSHVMVKVPLLPESQTPKLNNLLLSDMVIVAGKPSELSSSQ